jgi:predicted component of type VI protein secretion system
MTEPLTNNRVVSHLQQLAQQLDSLVSTMDLVEKNAVNAREDYTRAYAMAFLRSEGSMDIRKHQATLDTAVSRLDAELAEQNVKAVRRQIDSVRIRIDVGRSMGAALRAELSTLGGQP